jgi:hypothetical protein
MPWAVLAGPSKLVPRATSSPSARRGWVLHDNIPTEVAALALARKKAHEGLTVQVSELVDGRWRVRYRAKDMLAPPRTK